MIRHHLRILAIYCFASSIASLGPATAADFWTTPARAGPSWTAIYIGLGIGYSHLDHDLRATYDLDTCNTAARTQTELGLLIGGCGLATDTEFIPMPEGGFPFLPPGPNNSGPYFQDYIGGSVELGEEGGDGAHVQGRIGADYQMGDFVAGIRGSVAFGPTIESTAEFDINDFAEPSQDLEDWGDFFEAEYTLRSELSWDVIGRLGRLVKPNLLLWGGVGVKQRFYEAEITSVRYNPTFLGEGTFLEPDPPRSGGVRDFSMLGGTIGGGAEALLGESGNWSVGAEAFYTVYDADDSYGDTPLLLVDDRFPYGAGDGTTIPGIGPPGVEDFDIVNGSPTEIEFRVFGNYRFNMGE